MSLIFFIFLLQYCNYLLIMPICSLFCEVKQIVLNKFLQFIPVQNLSRTAISRHVPVDRPLVTE